MNRCKLCPPTGWYRFGKFARRNKTALVTASVVAAALLAGAALATWQAVQAKRAQAATLAEKRRADQEAVTARRVTASLEQTLGLIDPHPASRSIMSFSA